MKYIDIHAHINFKAYDDDRAEVISRAKEAKVGMINVGTMQKTSEEAVKLAEENENMFAIIGLHPAHVNKSFHDVDEIGEEGKAFTSRGEDFDYDFYKKLGENGKVVGIGECGLDYFRVEGDKEEYVARQKDAFRKQIELAVELDVPLMIHCREAYPDTLEILHKYKKIHGDKLRGNFHFFAGDLEQAKEILDLGFRMSFTGVITFAKDYKELVEFVPLEEMFSETDCPYVTPVPFRGQRNEPIHVREVVKKIAEIKGIEEEDVRVQLLKNAVDFFNLK